MNDRDLLDLIDILREIPHQNWELFSFIRQMDQKDVNRLKDLVQPAVPLPSRFSAVKTATEPGDADVKFQESQASEMFIDDLRKFL